jgi:type III restriction enzyme
MFELKNYQERALKTLGDFLTEARFGNVAEAFKKAYEAQELSPIDYRHHGFGEMPYVCLRLPTGGGKTVLASYSVGVAKKTYLEQDYPIVLWLVPTKTIREQTLEALKKAGHPYRQALEKEFGQDGLRVFDIGDVTDIRKHEIGRKALVIVSTLAALRVEDTSGRAIYAHHEDFETFFVGITDYENKLERITEKDVQENGLQPQDIGKIKASFANLLALYQPLIIMDEAHNARTKLTFETLKRVHPACIIEFTATPDTSKESASNVLYRCSASELKAEHMIKLPIVLMEHNHWQDAVQDAVLRGKELTLAAQKESDLVRPIVLFQAEAKNGEVTVEVLKAHLLEYDHVQENEIAIATGKQRELDGLDLFSPACRIKYIITIEALKEGWDCSFAYVFCSVKNVKSSTDAEQLLGRVLRMPYAKQRQNEALNRAYAHLASSDFGQVAKQLTDKLVDMGFEALEAAQNLVQQTVFDNENPEALFQKSEPILRYETEVKPDVTQENIVVTQTENNTFHVEVKGEVTPEIKAQLLKTVTGKAKQEINAKIENHNLKIEVARSPSERGEVFKPLPLLCYKQNSLWELLDKETFLYWRGEWSLLDFPVELPNFNLKQTERTYEIDIDGKKLSYQITKENEAHNLDMVDGGYTENEVVFWLEKEVRNINLIPTQLRAFLTKLIAYLTKTRSLPLTGLVRSKNQLARAVREQIEVYRKQAAEHGQNDLFKATENIDTRFDYSFQFSPNNYPARPPFYQGRYKFTKHFYPAIEFMKEDGEEFKCAQIIDMHPKVKHWVKNLVNRDGSAFRLPLAKGWFYPDFVVELTDGRLLVVEYKGKQLATNDDSREKNIVGELWAKKSNGRCLFLMAELKNTQEQNVAQQIDAMIESGDKNVF